MNGECVGVGCGTCLAVKIPSFLKKLCKVEKCLLLSVKRNNGDGALVGRKSGSSKFLCVYF